MSISTVFTNNRTQAVRLPADVRLQEDVKQVTVRAKGKERIIAPLNSSWDSFLWLIRKPPMTLWKPLLLLFAPRKRKLSAKALTEKPRLKKSA